jgi:hypothetical protein
MQFAAPQRGAVLLFEHIVSPRPGPRQFQAVTERSFFCQRRGEKLFGFSPSDNHYYRQSHAPPCEKTRRRLSAGGALRYCADVLRRSIL